MAPDTISPDALKLALVAALGAVYAVHKFGLIDRLRAVQGERTVSFRPRPVIVPRKIRFERAVLDVCDVDQVQLIRLTSRLRKMGFWIVGDFALPSAGGLFSPGQKTFSRAFVHGEEPIYGILSERHGRNAPPLYLDFITLFVDQTFLTASNSDENADFRRPGALRFHRLPGLLPEELYQHHWANLEALRGNWLKAVPASRDAFFAHYRQWLAVDYELRRAKDEDIRKDALFRALESLPPLDISPILRRYDPQRPPGEAISRPESQRSMISEPSSPTIIREPERAPIRRRLPPTPSASPDPAPRDASASRVLPENPPAFGDTLATDPAAFQEVVYDIPPEITQAHPLELLEQFESAPRDAEASRVSPPAEDVAVPAEPDMALPPMPDLASGTPTWPAPTEVLLPEDPILPEEVAFSFAGDAPLVDDLPFESEQPAASPPEQDPDDLGIPTDPPIEIDPRRIAEGITREMYISLSQLKSWRPPDFTDPDTPSLLESGAGQQAEPDAPERCPHCHARTLSRYSQRCHRCRQPLLGEIS